ncbi:MAG: VOC family protein [Chloroflexi bacterium]|nr:VOC family protein [Chloroflexota bacterium]
MPRVVHFEFAVEDAERAIAFYQKVFGWQIMKWEGPVDYWLIGTGEEGEPGIDGALMRRQEDWPSIINTVDVKDLDASLQAVQDQGGALAGPKTTIPGVGYMAYVKDTEGNIFGMMQSDPAATGEA